MYAAAPVIAEIPSKTQTLEKCKFHPDTLLRKNVGSRSPADQNRRYDPLEIPDVGHI